MHLLGALFLGGPAPTCSAPSPCGVQDPFDAGKARLRYRESLDVGFRLIQSTDPNLWDLTFLDHELWAIVVSAEVDELARLEVVDGKPTFVSQFVASGDTGRGLTAVEGELLVDSYTCPDLGSGTCIHRYSPEGIKLGELPQVLTGGERGMASIRDTVWQLGNVAGDCFGIFSTPVATPSDHKNVCLPNHFLPDLLTASNEVLIVAESSGDSRDIAAVVRSLRTDGTVLQDFVIPLPDTASEVTGIAYDTTSRTFVVGDRRSSQVHFFDVECEE